MNQYSVSYLFRIIFRHRRNGQKMYEISLLLHTISYSHSYVIQAISPWHVSHRFMCFPTCKRRCFECIFVWECVCKLVFFILSACFVFMWHNQAIMFSILGHSDTCHWVGCYPPRGPKAGWNINLSLLSRILTTFPVCVPPHYEEQKEDWHERLLKKTNAWFS